MIWLRFVLVAVFLNAFSFSGTAQEQVADNPPPATVSTEELYKSWDKFVQLTESMTTAKNINQSDFDNLRADLVDWRSRFAEERNKNSTQITTIKNQIAALGPKPDDGSELAEVTKTREQLGLQLAELEAPVKQGILAYSQADDLIKNLDKLTRDRQTRKLLELGPSPLLPHNWGNAIDGIKGIISNLVSEIKKSRHSAEMISQTQDKLPLTLLLVLLGTTLVFYGRRTIRFDLSDSDGVQISSMDWLKLFLQSFLTKALPFIGFLMIVQGVLLTGMVGDTGRTVLIAVSWAAFVIVVLRFVAVNVFPNDYLRPPFIWLNDKERRNSRHNTLIISVISGLYILAQHLARAGGWSETTYAVVIYPLLVLGAWSLWREGVLLNRYSAHPEGQNADSEELCFRMRLIRPFAIILMACAFVSPILAGVGYIRAGEFLLIPVFWTIATLGAALVLQDLAVELYILATRNKEARKSLFPVFMGILLFTAAIPIIAIFWGARAQDLSEIWNMIVQGFDIGGINISPRVFIILILIFMIGYTLTRLIQGVLKNTILPRTQMNIGGQNAIVAGVGYVGIFLAAFVAIYSAGINLSSLAIVAGALSVGIGFGLQNIVSNFVSGVILLIERPISQGDWIEVGGKMGYVRRISVRSTQIETFDHTDLIIPNADLVSGTVTNYTHGNTVGRIIVPVGVAYGTDTHKVTKILQEVIDAHPMVLANPAPAVLLLSFGDSSLNFEIRAMLRDVNWIMRVHSELNHEIIRRFIEEGIEIPFPQRDVWLRQAPATPPMTPQTPPQSPMTKEPSSLAKGDGS